MRRWQNLAAPDDPESWFDVGGVWATKRGTYETADVSAATALTAAASGVVGYAFVGNTLTGSREFVISTGGAPKIWEYSGGTLTDRTNSVSIGTLPYMAMYGSIVICAMGVGTATVYSTATTFSALAGAPQAEIVLTCANAVIYLNTNTAVDGWAASDVGDYTNYTTNEAATGRLIETPGPILAGCVWNGDVYAIKRDAIYRGTYVGGEIKWLWKCVWKGSGITTQTNARPKYQAVACSAGIAFNAATSGTEIHLFDGASRPIHLNPNTTLTSGALGCQLVYDPEDDVLCVAPVGGSNASGAMRDGESRYYHYFHFQTGMWGKGFGVDGEDCEATTSAPFPVDFGVVMGDYYARGYKSSKPVFYRYKNITTGQISRCAPSAPVAATTCYVETSKFGQPDIKTRFDQAILKLRRRTDLGTDSITVDLKLFREIEDTSAQTTRSAIAESSYRKKFDLQGGVCVDNFARLKFNFTALDIEVDDAFVKSTPAGKN